MNRALYSLVSKGDANLVKILCLGAGLALGLIMLAEVIFERSYDNFIPRLEDTYRIQDLGDQEVGHLKEKERTNVRKGTIGFVFQSFNLIDELNVFDNIELPLTYLGIPAEERKRTVTEIMKRMNISHRAQHYPQQLSGGQPQRVAIARAVVSDPKIILADEPTGNLDSKNGQEVMELLTELNREGTTIVMVTHSQRDAGFAGRVINLFDGQIVSSIAEM